MAQNILEDSIGYWVNITAAKLKTELLRTFKSSGYNVTSEHWAVLATLWEEDGRTQSEIAGKLEKDKTNVTRMLDVMERNELVERHSHEKDRRSYRIFLTRKGRDIKEELISLEKQVDKTSTRGLSKKEIQEIKRLLKIMYENLS